MIKITVSENYKNDKLNQILSKKDHLINQTILDYGLILYENQGNILKSITIDNDIKIKNEEIDKIKKELNTNKQKYDEIINNITIEKEKEIETLIKEKNDIEKSNRDIYYKKEKELNEIIKNINIEKQKEIENILNDKKNIDNKIREDYFKKEKEYELIINKIENDKIIQREKYLNEIHEIELKIKDQYENKIKHLETDIDKLKTEKTLEITALIEKGKQITKDDYEKIIELHKKMNDDLKTSYDNQIKYLNEKNNNLDNNIKYLQNNIQDLNNKLMDFNKLTENNKYESINGNINVLNEKVSTYFDKIFKGNTEKGIFGENFIENYLTDKFTNSKIIDCSKEFAKGDIFFVFNQMKTLIESKNIITLKKDDTDKFYRDIQVRISKGEINSALLISLNNTNLVNGVKHMHFEIRFGIPIIMISDVFNNTEFIRFAILILNYLIENGYANNESDDEKIYFVINSLNEIFMSFKYQLNLLQNDKNMLLKFEESFVKREKDIYNIDKLLKNIFSKFPEYNINQKMNNSLNKDIKEDSEDTLNIIINKIKTKIDENPNFIINIKNLEELDISSSLVRKNGGLKKILEIIKNNNVV
jgi:hypothetical protein